MGRGSWDGLQPWTGISCYPHAEVIKLNCHPSGWTQNGNCNDVSYSNAPLPRDSSTGLMMSKSDAARVNLLSSASSCYCVIAVDTENLVRKLSCRMRDKPKSLQSHLSAELGVDVLVEDLGHCCQLQNRALNASALTNSLVLSCRVDALNGAGMSKIWDLGKRASVMCNASFARRAFA